MAAKLKLEVDTLAVESFATAAATPARGTVRGEEAACTCYRTCLCPSAPFFCADVPLTYLSCDYTANGSCLTPAAAELTGPSA